jgi:hypothetical protein
MAKTDIENKVDVSLSQHCALERKEGTTSGVEQLTDVLHGTEALRS